jgi:hypothetical protein
MRRDGGARDWEPDGASLEASIIPVCARGISSRFAASPHFELDE